MRRLVVLLCGVFSFASLSCGGESGPDLMDPPPEGEGFQFSLVTVAPAGQETWVCALYDMPITRPASVNWAAYQQTLNTHHMTLSTFLEAPDLENGVYDCNDLYGDTSLMEDQIMFFGAQGDAEGELHLPEGVAANFIPGLKVLHEIHFVNTTDEDIDLYSVVNGYTIPAREVEDGIWGGQVRDETIMIPARETTTEWTRCVMNEDVNIQFLASHMHSLGIDFSVRAFDGTETGELLFQNNDWHTPGIQQFDPPLVVPAGTGFEYSCTWENVTDADVTYGLESTDEMCNLALVHTPASMSARCEVVETSDGVLWTP